jgi:hypothetical protein
MVSTRKVGHPIHNDFHPTVMGCSHERLLVCEVPEFGVHGRIIRNGIISSQDFLMVLPADGIDRHEPEGRDTHGLQPVEGAAKGIKGHLRRVLPYMTS